MQGDPGHIHSLFFGAIEIQEQSLRSVYVGHQNNFEYFRNVFGRPESIPGKTQFTSTYLKKSQSAFRRVERPTTQHQLLGRPDLIHASEGGLVRRRG